VDRVHRIVGGGQRMHLGARLTHMQFGDRAVFAVHHRCGEVGRKVLDPIDDVDQRTPTAHGVEGRITDAVYRRLSTHAVIERIWILQSVGTEKLDGSAKTAMLSA
jgi:hypothetical protein